ncbi:hypothetical protein V6N13_042045 [Hibiscus sabdariffa]
MEGNGICFGYTSKRTFGQLKFHYELPFSSPCRSYICYRFFLYLRPCLCFMERGGKKQLSAEILHQSLSWFKMASTSSCASSKKSKSKGWSGANWEYDGEEIFCYCGVKCPMWTAWKNTENIGRRFFSCPN